MIDTITDFFSVIGNFFSNLITNLLGFLYDFLFVILDLLFGWINIPPFPVELRNSIDSFLNIIFDNLRLLGFFIRPTTLKIVIPILLILFNFEYIYKFIMWIVKKIPMINIK